MLTIGPVPAELAHVGTDLAASAAAYDARPLTAAVLAPDHIVSIAYTGGTTGKPKGVIGTAQAMNTMSQVQLAEWEWPREPRFLMCTPLSHAGAAFFVPTVIQGGSLFVLPRFDPAEVLETIERERITATMLVPTMLYALMDHPDAQTRDLSSLETVYYGASAINPTRLQEAIERFGPIFAQYYGQSEAPMVITYLAKGDHTPERLASCGRPTCVHPRRHCSARTGTRCAVGEPGEICVRRTAAGRRLLEAARGDGRDVPGRLAAHRRRRTRGRGRLLVHRRSHQGHDRDRRLQRLPARGRGRRRDHPAVAQVAVIGTPHERYGEAVTAFVVPRNGAALDEATIAEIQALVKERKGSLHAPKQVIAVDRAIPLTGLGKPDKKALRAQYWTGERSVG